MPALITSATKGKIAVLTNRKFGLRVGRDSFGLVWRRGLLVKLLLVLVIGIFFHLMKLKSFRLLVFLGSSGTLTPWSRTVYGIFVTLEFRLVLETHIPLHHFRLKWDLQQFARTDERLGLSPLASRLESSFAFFCAARLKAPDCGKVSFFDGVVVKVLQALNTEDMAAV